MKRVLAALCALAGASGCYGTTYVETPAPQYGTTMEYIPDNPPAPIAVSMAPPAPRYEPVLTCGYGTIFVPGRWDWAGRWFWARGYCSPVRPGYIYVGPRFIGGSYYRAHWAQSGYGAPAYPASPVYRPAPVYGGGDIPDDHLRHLLDQLHQKLGTSVRIVPTKTLANGKKTRGLIEIDFYNSDDLDRILVLLGLAGEL